VGPPGVVVKFRSIAMPWPPAPPMPLLKMRLPRIGTWTPDGTRTPSVPLYAMTSASPGASPPIAPPNPEASTPIVRLPKFFVAVESVPMKLPWNATAFRRFTPVSKPPTTLPSPAPVPPTLVLVTPLVKLTKIPVVPLVMTPDCAASTPMKLPWTVVSFDSMKMPWSTPR
jgi:hypothetical protein